MDMEKSPLQTEKGAVKPQNGYFKNVMKQIKQGK